MNTKDANESFKDAQTQVMDNGMLSYSEFIVVNTGFKDTIDSRYAKFHPVPSQSP